MPARPHRRIDARQPVPDPDLGPNVLILDPAMPAADVQARLDAIFAAQESAHFGDRRDAVLFKPGRYAADVRIGFFTQILGLGADPRDVVIDGRLRVDAGWFGGNALVNFWRGAENLAVRPDGGTEQWAVSQAAPFRRIDLDGDVVLDDGGSSSGGFLADSRVAGTIRSGTQQQWLTRSSDIGGWDGGAWNMVFAGVTGAPPTRFPAPPHTSVPSVARMREKPFLCIDAAGAWGVFVPALRHEGRGPSWVDGPAPGRFVPLAQFRIVRPGMDAGQINAALDAGLHLLLTPGLYPLDAPIAVARPGTIVLGIGLATLVPVAGTAAIRVADVAGVTIAGLLVDAGPVESPMLVEMGPRGACGDHAADPSLLADLFFRVGGAAPGRAETCLEINSAQVIGDHLWLWRADHGELDHSRVHVGWGENTGAQGLVVHGDDVAIYGLFVEHFQKHQLVWNGARGTTVFFQSELPYDPPSQTAYRSGPDEARGWAAYKVADDVAVHRAVGLGVYAYFNADPSIVVDCAVEAPCRPGVRFESVTTLSLGGGVGTIAHLVNEAGAAACPGAVRQTLLRYP
ncbi:adenylyl cyclase [Sphingomonas sp. CJ20]